MNQKAQPSQTVTWAEIEQKLGLDSTSDRPTSNLVQGSALRQYQTMHQMMQTSCCDGERTAYLTRLIGTLIHEGFGLPECILHCHTWNSGNNPPLPDEKVEATCRSIFNADQRNHPERHQSRPLTKPLFELSAGRIDRFLRIEPSPRRWLIKNFIPLGKVGAVVAPGGSSKSQWLLQLAVSVATGLPLANHWEVGETGGVLVLFAEDDDEEIHRRLHRISQHFSVTGDAVQMKTAHDRLYIFSTIGTDTLLTKRDRSGEVTGTEIVDRIVLLANQIPDLRLIVIDPGSRFRGGEENSNEDGTRFVEALESISQKSGATIIVAHHTNKGSYNTDATPGQGASRGASSLTDGLRWQLNLGKPSTTAAKNSGLLKDSMTRLVQATVTKSNYSAIPEPILMQRCDDGYLSVVAPGQVDHVAASQLLKRILALISESKPMSARGFEEQHGGVTRTLHVSGGRLRTELQRARRNGYLAVGNRSKLVLTSAGLEFLGIPAFPGDAMRNH